MRGHVDEWVENRMLWKLAQSLPDRSSVYVFSENHCRFPAELVHCEAINDLGIPVFAILGTENWSLFGTRKIISYYLGILSETDVDCIYDFDGPQLASMPKA